MVRTVSRFLSVAVAATILAGVLQLPASATVVPKTGHWTGTTDQSGSPNPKVTFDVVNHGRKVEAFTITAWFPGSCTWSQGFTPMRVRGGAFRLHIR